MEVVAVTFRLQKDGEGAGSVGALAVCWAPRGFRAGFHSWGSRAWRSGSAIGMKNGEQPQKGSEDKCMKKAMKYVKMYTYMCVCVCIYIYIYVYRYTKHPTFKLLSIFPWHPFTERVRA